MKNFFRTLISIAGFAIGPGIVTLIYGIIKSNFGVNPEVELLGWVNMLIYITSAIFSGIIFIFLSKKIVDGYISLTNQMENGVDKFPARTVIFTILGAFIGIVVAFFVSWMLEKIPSALITVPVSIIVFIMLAYAGGRLGKKFAEKLSKGKKVDFNGEECPAAKVLDTSVIIDGRVFDILKTGMIEGTIIIPEFVLSELRHIADSADNLKRTKGRRGLDILKKIQSELDLPVDISNIDYEDVAEVDAKLIRLAKELGATVLTNDFNLNKVAAVQGVKVFNINELANAVKPMLLPGEELLVTVVKEGKEYGQGVAFLDDGTMIVVENAKDKIGKTHYVVVTSALQTAAGRMVFAKIKE